MLVILLVPFTRAAWKSMGMGSIAIPFLPAGLVDGAYFGLDWTKAGWVNNLFVWVGVHQLGYAWLDGRFASRLRSALWGIIGLGSRRRARGRTAWSGSRARWSATPSPLTFPWWPSPPFSLEGSCRSSTGWHDCWHVVDVDLDEPD